jgi:hypothetical protein
MISNLGSSHQDPPPKSPLSYWNWADIKGRTREILSFLPLFLKNPVEGIKRVPSWDWPTVILLEILLSMATGFLAGIFSRNFLAVIFGLVAAPIMGVILSFILAGIFYYACLFVMRTEVEYKRVFVIVVLAKIPSQILGILYPLVNFITLFSIIVTALLLIVGLSENFMLERKKVSQVVGVIAGIAMIVWLYSTVINVTSNRIKIQEITPDSLNQIHKEMGESK